MKLLRFFTLLILLASLMTVVVSANEIYLPTPDEVGDLETNPDIKKPAGTQSNTETVAPEAPHAVNFKTNILLPTATCIAVSVAIFSLAYAVKAHSEKKEAPSGSTEE